MTKYAALDVSMEQTAICVVDENGGKVAEGKVPTDPDALTAGLAGGWDFGIVKCIIAFMMRALIHMTIALRHNQFSN